MEKKTKRILQGSFFTLLFTGVVLSSIIGYLLFSPQFFPTSTAYVYVDSDDTADSIFNKIKSAGKANNLTGYQWLSYYRDFPQYIYTGRYAIHHHDNVYHVFHRLYRGHQTPMNLTIGSVRTLDKLCKHLGRQLMIDSAEIAQKMKDTTFIQQLGYQSETLPCLFIPNTYEVYWNLSVDALFQRMQKEHNLFWNQQRINQAKALGLTPAQVCTLASIVEEETNNAAEKPMVAGLYLNRLKCGMPLQADPTIKFALQDFSLRRITRHHLQTASPYNTYLNPGLPPGPIRIPSTSGIDAVLNPVHHNYLYMCAKEDFSGTHYFAATLSAHMNNARKYWNALNKRKIFK